MDGMQQLMRDVATEVPDAAEHMTDHMAVLAHELSNPIVSIAAAAQVLAKDCSEPDLARRARAIAEEARHVFELLEGLTEVSALESGRMQMSMREVDLSAVIRCCAELAGGDVHPVRTDIPARPVVVWADDRRVRQVVRNLLANATKYSAPGSRVDLRVGLTADGESAIVHVEDQGPGIPPLERHRLFRKFTRLTTAGSTRGTGLGLYLCRAIVQQHSGRIWGEWPAGGGSVFAFTLPLAR